MGDDCNISDPRCVEISKKAENTVGYTKVSQQFDKFWYNLIVVVRNKNRVWNHTHMLNAEFISRLLVS